MDQGSIILLHIVFISANQMSRFLSMAGLNAMAVLYSVSKTKLHSSKSGTYSAKTNENTSAFRLMFVNDTISTLYNIIWGHKDSWTQKR